MSPNLKKWCQISAWPSIKIQPLNLLIPKVLSDIEAFYLLIGIGHESQTQKNYLHTYSISMKMDNEVLRQKSQMGYLTSNEVLKTLQKLKNKRKTGLL